MSADPNKLAYERMIASHPWLVAVRPAAEVVPGMRTNLILHAAPPTTWTNMSELMRGGMIGAALSKGLAARPPRPPPRRSAARSRSRPPRISAPPPAASARSPRALPVMVVEDSQNGNRSTHFLMEGLGRTLVAGAYDEARARPAALVPRQFLGRSSHQAIVAQGGIDVRELMAEALDARRRAAQPQPGRHSLFVNRIALALAEARAGPVRAQAGAGVSQ